MKQSTLRHPIWCRGVGLHTGNTSLVRLVPAGSNTGIVFRLMGDGEIVEISSHHANTISGSLRTVVGVNGRTIETTEHLMAVLHAYRVTNLAIEIWGNELPIFDGSSDAWAFLVACAGIDQQQEDERSIRVLRRVEVTGKGAWCSISPCDGFEVMYDLSYDHPMIGRQIFDIAVNRGSFENEMSRARTFGFYSDLDRIRKQGLATGATLSNTLVFGETDLMGPTSLRWIDEPARHKAVDAIGDLYMAGSPMQGRFEGYRSGHDLNRRLISKLMEDQSAWCYDTMLTT